MMRVFCCVCILILTGVLLSPVSRAQGVEIYGGYSFARAPVTFQQSACPTCGASLNTHNLNLNGWEISGAFKLLGPLALKADFSETSGSFQAANTHLQTYLFGPQLRFPGPISPFAHLLVGGAHESIGTSPDGLTGGPTQNAFATAIGGGIDLKVLPFISIRPVQFDYVATRFNSKTQNQPRFSAGILVRF